MQGRVTRRQLLAGGLGAAGLGVLGLVEFGPLRHGAPQTRPSPPRGGAGKQPLRGLLGRHSQPTYDWMLGWALTVRWTDIQESAGAPLRAGNPIDHALDACDSFNAAHPQTDPSLRRGVRLRFESLTRPGSWPTTVGGGPVSVTDPTNQHATEVGAFWKPEFAAAYKDLQAKLAAAYDAAPALRENGLAMIELVYDEPFRRYSFSELEAAGWTEDLDRQAFRAMMDAHEVWRLTPQFLSFNPYATPGGGTDENFTEQVMREFRSRFGTRAVLMNNSIRAAAQGPDYQSMYSLMSRLGPPVSFQTAALARVGDVGTTLSKCVQLGASSVELPDPYTGIPTSLLESVQTQLLTRRS